MRKGRLVSNCEDPFHRIKNSSTDAASGFQFPRIHQEHLRVVLTLNGVVFVHVTNTSSAVENAFAMSTLVLQVGQGGNQYGLSFFDAMAQACASSSLPWEFFEEGQKHVHVARAVLIDMEPKVVTAVAKRANASGIWKYGAERFTVDSGSGNNWAAGFCSNGAAYHEPLLQQIRVKVEACDDFGGFLAIQSLAGGTGAGLGAYLLETLKDEYPSSCIMSHCIWPYENGEVVVQNYNVLLTLAKLQEVADGIITVQNEALASICKRSLGILRPSFNDMNSVGAHSLASVLLPSYWRPVQASQDPGLCASSMSVLKVRLLSDLIYALCAHPGYRMLSLHSTPQIRAESLDFTTFTWSSQLKQLKRSIFPVELNEVRGDTSLRKSVQKSVASLLVLRGKGSWTVDVNLFAESSLYPRWCIDPLNVSAHNSSFDRCEVVAGMVSNCQSAILPASKVLARAYSMYFSKAYLHQYFQHGLDYAFFDAAFATVEDVLLRYSTL